MKVGACDYLVTSQDIAEATNLKELGVRQSYIHQEEKQKTLKALGLGAMCILNNITPTKLQNIIEFNQKQEAIYRTELNLGDNNGK